MAVWRTERKALGLLRAMVGSHHGLPAPATPSNGGGKRTGNGHVGNGNGNGGTGHLRRRARIQPMPAVLEAERQVVRVQP